MNTSMSLTAKDKKLLIYVGIGLLALFIIMFGIKPAFTSLSTTKAEKATLSAKKTTMEQEIAALPQYEASYDEAVANYKKTAARVFGDLKSDTIQDAVINGLTTPCGLSVTNFSINEIALSNVSAFSATTGKDGTTENNGGVTGENAKVNTANITVNVFGSTDQIITFIDKLNSDEGIYLQQTSFSNTGENTSVAVTFLMVLSDTF